MKVNLFQSLFSKKEFFVEKTKAQLVKTGGYKYFTRYSARANRIDLLLGKQGYAMNNHENL